MRASCAEIPNRRGGADYPPNDKIENEIEPYGRNQLPA